jgi:hypothetical protein
VGKIKTKDVKSQRFPETSENQHCQHWSAFCLYVPLELVVGGRSGLLQLLILGA